jgi:hypothetical protein
MRARSLAVVLAVGCGETQPGPFQALPLENRITSLDLDETVHVARDRFGIAHAYARTHGDLWTLATTIGCTCFRA